MFENLSPLAPSHFVQLGWECPRLKGAIKTDKSYRFPETADLLGEESFASLYVGWSEEGLSFLIESKGDLESVELFLDTRDLKTKGQISRFCHHFFYPVSGSPREMTRFRGEDHHRLADPEQLKMKLEKGWRGMEMTVVLSPELLHGFDPAGSPRIGFAYRIRSQEGAMQCFPVSSEDVTLEQHPAAWATLLLNYTNPGK